MRRNTGRKQANFSRIPLETPDTFPSLKRPIAMLNQDPISKAQTKELGKYSISLLSSLSLSIYKKLFARNVNKDVLFNYQDIKNIRNLYLKRLVESNQENFPYELSQDEYKVVEQTKDEKIKVMMERLREIAKNDKGKSNHNNSLEVSRKSSVNRKESLDETKKINDRSNKEKMMASKRNELQTNNSANTTQNNINNDNSEEDENEHNNSQSYEDEENYINDPEDDDGDNEGDYSANLDEGGEY